MTRMLRKARNEGLSLRSTFFVMLIISLGVTGILLFTIYRTFNSYNALSDATDTYIELQQAADNLMRASDYLTEEARCYVVLGDRDHLDNYFHEAEVVKRRENAIRVMESRLPLSDALDSLKDAMEESLSLMDREYYSMLLVLKAEEDENIPEAMRNTTLKPEDEALTAEKKMLLAQRMMHDGEYYVRKYRIRANLQLCINALKNSTHGTQNEMETRVYGDLVWTAVLIILQSVFLILLLFITTRLGINPLLQAVEHIKKDQKLPIMGAHEFRYLAGTYNKMYTAYKKSISKLSFKASHDELTNVYNRAGYDLIIRSIDTSSTAYLLIDADKFKKINDQNGHEVGDRILKKLADTLRQNFRPDDYIFRIGGDEFVVFMVHVDQKVRHLIEKKVEQINMELANTEDGLPEISVSVGVSLCPENAQPQEMYREADIALYYVKENGRKGCSFYRPGLEQKAG